MWMKPKWQLKVFNKGSCNLTKISEVLPLHQNIRESCFEVWRSFYSFIINIIHNLSDNWENIVNI